MHKPVDTNSPQFKAWFRKSLVVDGEGKPLRVFHGTLDDADSGRKAGFDTFKHTKEHLNQKHGGFFFTNDPNYAGDYSGMTSIGSSTIPVYLRIENPMSFEQYINIMRYGSLEAPKTAAEISQGWAKARTVDMAILGKQLGYDGVITDKAHEFGSPNMKGTPSTYIVFNANQIKSAISNTGNFNDEDPSMLEQTEPLMSFMTESKAFRNEQMVDKYTTKELGEILYAMMLSIHCVGAELEVRKYCINSLKFPRYDHIFLSSTDLANAITSLRHAREILDQPNVDVPVNDIKRYLRDFVLGKLTPEFSRRFFYGLQTKLRVKSPQLTNIRRMLIDGDANQGDKAASGRLLYQQLAALDKKVDVLALLQILVDKLTES